MNAPAGWYPTPEGMVRYWDGARWTVHVAPAPPCGAPMSSANGVPHIVPSRGQLASSPPGLAAWFGWGAASVRVAGGSQFRGERVLRSLRVVRSRGGGGRADPPQLCRPGPKR